MLSLNLPTFAAKVKEKDGKHTIFDPVRRKYVALTPEEWVRQHFVNYLITHKGYPKELLANEVPLKIKRNIQTMRFSRIQPLLAPLMIVEYKAPTIEITSAVFDQIVRYNMVLHVRYLAVSNGISHFCCKIDYENLTYSFLEGIPEYKELE